MAKPIKIVVSGNEIDGQDAPTVEDLLAQIQDVVNVLKGVEEAIALDGKREIIWRVTNVTKNSPLTFEITPFPKTHAMNIDRRAEQVVTSSASGLGALASGGERPAYFSNELMDRVEKVYQRVTNGLSATKIDFGGYVDAPAVEISKPTVRAAVASIKRFQSPTAVTHKELGSIEGVISRVELDGNNRPVVWLRSRLDGQTIRCAPSGGALDHIGHYEVAEVLRGMRVIMYGVVNYKSLEDVASIDVDRIHVFAPDSELPGFEKIVSPNFTKGVEASDYLEAVRQDG